MKKLVILLSIIMFFSTAAFAAGSSSKGGGHSHSSRSGHSHSGKTTHSGGGASHKSGTHSPHHGHHQPSHHPSHRGNYHDHNSSSSSNQAVLTDSVQELSEIKFPNCYKHYAVKDTTTDYYSDGSKRIHISYTLYNSDGAVLAENCKALKHILYGDNHYFIIGSAKGYMLANENAESITERKYNYMDEAGVNRLIVRYNDHNGIFSKNKYGIIDFGENEIIPIKYDSIDSIGNDIFITKLNGYYGMTDIDNNQLIANNCDKIKNIYNIYLIKRYGKYGLADKFGGIILGTNYDKIKKLGEYLLVKKNDRYGVWDANGKIISEIKYKSVKLDRNVLRGKTPNGSWEDIPQR